MILELFRFVPIYVHEQCTCECTRACAHTQIYTLKDSGNDINYVGITWQNVCERGEVRILSDTELITCRTHSMFSRFAFLLFPRLSRWVGYCRELVIYSFGIISLVPCVSLEKRCN